jgi:serine/threonine protein kinase
MKELMESGSLSSCIKEKKLTMEQKFNILLDITSGMCFLHSRSTPIIHRGKFKNII